METFRSEASIVGVGLEDSVMCRIDIVGSNDLVTVGSQTELMVAVGLDSLGRDSVSGW